MSREVHVRFCERLEVKSLWPTHPYIPQAKGFVLHGPEVIATRGRSKPPPEAGEFASLLVEAAAAVIAVIATTVPPFLAG